MRRGLGSLGASRFVAAFGLCAVSSLVLPGDAWAQLGGGGGFGGNNSTEQTEFKGQLIPVQRPSRMLSAEAAKTWLKLDRNVDFVYPNETPLEKILNAVQELTRDPKDGDKKGTGVAIYVDPVGLQEAEKTLQSPITLSLKNVTLTTALRLSLKQLGLVFSVNQEGLVTVTAEASEDLTSDSIPVGAAAARTWIRLNEPVDLKVAEETSLVELLQNLKKMTRSDELPRGVQFFVEHAQVGEGQLAPETITADIDLDGVSLASALELITGRLDMTYRVRNDGIVLVRPTARDTEEEDLPPLGHGADTIEYLKAVLAEAKLRAEIANYRAQETNPRFGAFGMGGMGGMGMGGMGGGAMRQGQQGGRGVGGGNRNPQ